MNSPPLGSALIAALLLTLAGGAGEPAEAGDWFIGGAFRVGGLQFSLAYDRHGRHSHRDYYYRTRDRVHYDGYRCGSYCFKRSGYGYHHARCPVVLHHFRLHHFHPAAAWGAYLAPGYERYYDRGRHYGHRDYGYRGHGHRDYGRRGHGYGHRDYHRGHDPRSCPYR